MWSIATKGFPPDVLWVSRLIGLFGGFRHLALTFVFGEIDVRVHLAGSTAQSRRGMRFVGEYVRQCEILGRRLRATSVLITVPVPPGEYDAEYDSLGLPRSGTLAERMDAFRMLRESLEAALATKSAEPTTILLDCTDKLMNSDGSLRVDLSDDGCHVNEKGAEVVREYVRALRR